MEISNRKFGVEIEFVSRNVHGVVDDLQRAGINVLEEHYNHTTRGHWKVVYDASCGWELVSPPLSGETGIDEVSKAVRALASSNARVNRNCGIHVHVDANDLNPKQVAAIAFRYARFENVFDSFMPPSRRENVSQWCASTSWRYTEWASRISDDRHTFNRAITQRGRYQKLNLVSYNRQGTVEYRHHSGSLNATKVTNWIRFCVAFQEASIRKHAEKKLGAETSERPAPRSRRNSSLRSLYSAFIRSEGEVLPLHHLARTTGASQNTVRAYVSRLRSEFGLDIRVARGLGYVFRGCLPVPVSTSAEDCWSDDIDPEVVDFYNERARHFASMEESEC